MKKLVDSFNSVTLDAYKKNKEIQDNFLLFSNVDGSIRAYHKKTAYQSNHITGKGDKWRAELTEEQKKRLLDITKTWLVKYGFVL